MSDSGLNKLTVLGAGVLGGQIAWQSAFCGKSVVVYDLYEEALQACRTAQETYAVIYQQDLDASPEDIENTRQRLVFSTDLAAAVGEADLVIEAVPEIPDVKIKLYEDMAGYLPEHTLLATNSSTFLPSQFAAASGRPEKYCALHFANLIWATNLAEIMAHQGSARSTLVAITQFAIEIGMVPIPLQKEQNGYVINSLLVPILEAAQNLITKGISTPETIDRTYMIMNGGCSYGPCATMDIVGMKTIYDIFSYWGQENGDEDMLANAQYIKTNFIDKGFMGLQSGKGYYEYPNPAFQVEGFLDVPPLSEAQALAELALPQP